MENREQEAGVAIFIIIALAASVVLVGLIGDVLNQLGGY